MFHGPYPEILPRLSSGWCIDCRKLFTEGSRRVPVFIVTAVDTHMSGAGRCLYVARFPEFRHADCMDPKRSKGPDPVLRRGPRYGMTHPDLMPVIEPRFPSYICATCHKEFAPGHRVIPAYIVAGTAKDPTSNHINAVASPNFECHHKNCADPTDSIGMGIILT